MFSIFDDKLINNLIRIAQAQATPPETSDAGDDDIKNLAINLVEKLKYQIDNPIVDKDVSLHLPDFQDINTFLNAINTNRIQYLGDYLIIDNATFNAKLKTNTNTSKIFFPYPPDEDEPKFYIYKNGLIGYLNFVKSEADKSKDKTFIAQVRYITDQVNEDLQWQVPVSKDKEQTITTQQAPGQQTPNQKTQISMQNRVYPLDYNVLNLNKIDRFADSFISEFGYNINANNIKGNIAYIKNNFPDMMVQSLTMPSVEPISSHIKTTQPPGVIRTDSMYISKLEAILKDTEDLLLYLLEKYENVPSESKTINEQKTISENNYAKVRSWENEIARRST